MDEDSYVNSSFEVLLAQQKEFIEEWCQPPVYRDPRIEQIIRSSDSAEDKWKQLQRLCNGKKKVQGNTYFCTLTTLPGFKDYKLWLQALYKVLNRKFVLSYVITAEHLDSNMHCHILIKAKQQVQKKHFHSYCKATGATIIDVRKVSEDNGIEDYMELENPTFTNFSEFQDFIFKHFNGSN